MTGRDGGMIRAQKLKMLDNADPNIEHDVGQVGDIVSIDPSVVKALQDDAFIPVISPIGFGENNESYNINADVVAAKLATVLKAEKLMMLTNISGVLDKSGKLLTDLTARRIDELFADGTISGGMLPKIAGALDAAKSGVNSVHIIDGRVPHVLLLEILTEQAYGTMIRSQLDCSHARHATLLVEDDVMVASGIKLGLTDAGYAVDWVGSAERALEVSRSEAFDVAIIDIGLPGMDGLALTQRLRKDGHAMPVLILTARDALHDRVQGLDMGADDYMVKPFELPELLARLRALLRRSQAATSSVLSFGPLELDTATRLACIRLDATAPALPIELGPREWTVMEYLLINAPKPANKDKLLQALTGWDKEITPNAVEVYISRLRGKLEPHGIALRSIRGFGYRLELSAPPDDGGSATPG